MIAVRKGKKIRQIIHRAFTHPETVWSRKRSPMIWNMNMRYAMNAKLTKMNQMMSQKLMAAG